MIQYVTTKHNPMVYPHLAVWGWDIAFYLFLGGTAAGILLISGIAIATRNERFLPTSTGKVVLLAPILLGIGMLGLLHNVENKLNLIAFYLFFNSVSPKSWGAWSLPAVLIVGGLFGLACLSESDRKWVGRWPILQRTLASLADYRISMAKAIVPLALFLGSYTGVLLSTNVGRPLWNASILGPLFMVSGTSTGSALLALLASSHREKVLLTRLDIPIIITELGWLMLLVIGDFFAAGPFRGAFHLLVGGPLSAPFWVLLVGIGLGIPLLIEITQSAGKLRENAVPALMVLLGGFVFRAIIVFGGQISSWTVH